MPFQIPDLVVHAPDYWARYGLTAKPDSPAPRVAEKAWYNGTMVSRLRKGTPSVLRRHSYGRPRLLSAFVALSYVVLSLALPFQHHHQGEEAQGLLLLCCSSGAGRATAPAHPHLRSNSSRAASDTCVACEWQTANVSAALPAFAVAFVLPQRSLVAAALPRYLRSRSLPITSRGPPVA